MKKLFTTSILLGCLIFYATAQIIHVPGDQTSIQAGIDYATDGDTVLVAEDTYFENINFKGKAITVASQFLIDGDTSHISSTIIDGSQPNHPDTASVVSMVSGEDTTSVLCGFTLKGGKGTYMLFDGQILMNGGGLNIYNSGGKIEHNIIEDNHMPKLNQDAFVIGFGINAWVTNNHTAIIRNNLVRNNTYSGSANGQGCGMFLGGGRFIIEGNTISGNITGTTYLAVGGGICYFRDAGEGVIPEVTIRNNIITGNELYSVTYYPHGAGIFLRGNYQTLDLKIYNNLIYNNHANDGKGGGIGMWEIKRAVIFNNTIVNNKAELGGKQLELENDTKVILFNNILWSDTDDGISEIYLKPNQNNVLIAEYNIIRDQSGLEEGVTAYNNTSQEPLFMPDSYELSENSPGIGWGVDSVEILEDWYYAPETDILAKKRPDVVDRYVDMGAFESPFARLISVADLDHIGLWDQVLAPSFHKDTLHYILGIPDTTQFVPQLEVIPADWLASVDIDPATDLASADPADRTTTITVTAPDEITQKTYTVEFYLAYTDASLSELTVSQGELDPFFDPGVFFYRVWLPWGSTETPEVNFTTSHPKAIVNVVPAEDITNSKKDITSITVTSEAGGIFDQDYYIEFSVDSPRPRISLVSDTVTPTDSIGAICTKNGQVYLVPANTDAVLDSLLEHVILSTQAVMNDTSYLPVSGLERGTYWLYAVNQYKSVSEAAPVIIIHGTGISQSNSTSIQLYPVPVEDRLIIKTSLDGIHHIEIASLNGQLIFSKEMEGTSHQIDLSSFQKGVYLITIRSEDFVTTRKIVKL